MFGRSKRLERKLRDQGRRAPAEVLEAEQTRVGITVGNPAFVGSTEIVWKLKLRVRPEGEPEFDADLKARFPQPAGPAKGMVLSVLYDPSDHSRVAIDQSQSGAVETAIGTALTSPAVQANPALAGPLSDLIQAAMADPAAFRQHMQVQAGAMAAAGLAATQPRADPVDQLARLADLLDRGALTKEEFEAQKKRILGENA